MAGRDLVRGIGEDLLATGLIVAALTGCACPRPRATEPEPLVWSTEAEEAAEDVLRTAIRNARPFKDYTCTFYRHERVGDRLGTHQRMEVKFRPDPFSLYMRWTDPAKAGAEVLYCQGRFDDVVFARQGGPLGWLLPPLRLTLDHPLLAANSRHPITDFGVLKVAERLLKDVERARAAGEFKACLLGDGDVYGEPAQGFEILLPDAEGYYARRLRLWFHHHLGTLSRIVAFDRDGQLLEDYAFTNLRPNAGLTDLDFDPANPKYRL